MKTVPEHVTSVPARPILLQVLVTPRGVTVTRKVLTCTKLQLEDHVTGKKQVSCASADAEYLLETFPFDSVM